MLDLQIISGTDRPGSNALRVSKYIQKKYREEGVDTGIIDMQNFPVDQVAGGKYGEELPEVEAFVSRAVTADGLVIVCPEYNGGYPGILKLFIDYFPFPGSLEKKPIALVGEASGAFGALRAVEQLQQVLGYRHAHIFPERVFIPRVTENFDDETGINDDFQQQLLMAQVTGFPQFVRDLNKDSVVS
ncbi:NADPH-dependent FMN reductase [Fodinibius halophilus]|uniref:NAD(P)H-dependent oxidoreductase n=1 Tax=Fodinibius halophilus TaxID=1736908 RepID=A0A6M1TG25_9BACT|nr:NAD(P)H-dependent oxidoreductase [Fodinibius halophilus]NGP87590.1 NAD(P)H-dependent oxidoreductase [Fodinibius halophilus]